MPLFKPGRTDLLPPQRTSSASSANDARRALLQSSWRPVAAANAHERIAVDLLVAFANVGGGCGGEARERASAQRVPLSGRVAAAGIGLESSCLRPLGRSERFALALVVVVAGCRPPRSSCLQPLGRSERFTLALAVVVAVCPAPSERESRSPSRAQRARRGAARPALCDSRR
eukprot:tig00021374_g21103.t1